MQKFKIIRILFFQNVQKYLRENNVVHNGLHSAILYHKNFLKFTSATILKYVYNTLYLITLSILRKYYNIGVVKILKSVYPIKILNFFLIIQLQNYEFISLKLQELDNFQWRLSVFQNESNAMFWSNFSSLEGWQSVL